MLTQIPQRDLHLNVFFNEGGLGDHIAKLPAIKYLSSFDHLKLHIAVPDYFVELAKELLPEIQDKRAYYTFSEIKDQVPSRGWEWNRPGVESRSANVVTALGFHPVNQAFSLLCDVDPCFVSLEDKSYIRYTPNQDPKQRAQLAPANPYIVLTPNFTAEVRALPGHIINKLIERFEDLAYDIVLLGSTEAKTGANENIAAAGPADIDTSYPGVVDLRDKTSLIEALEIMDSAACVIGLDNGLLHLAGCTATPIVGLYTNVAAELREPYRADVRGRWIGIQANGCNACQSSCKFDFTHDFRKCYFGPNKKCNEQFSVDTIIRIALGLING